jgi:mRNA interferase MazF
MEVKRGAIVTVAASGDFAGKPRPAVVLQSDLFNETHASVTVAPITTTLVDAELFRIDVSPSSGSGLQRKSQVMVDKLTAVRRDRLGKHIGHLSAAEQTRVDIALRTWLGL